MVNWHTHGVSQAESITRTTDLSSTNNIIVHVGWERPLLDIWRIYTDMV